MNAPMIDPKQVYRKLEQGEAVRLIDVRTPGEYRAEHVEQAELMPLDELDPASVKASNGTPVYLLCRTGRRARTAWERLDEAGLSDAQVVEGGLEAWQQAELPVVKGKGVISLERQVRIAAGTLVLLGLILGWLAHPGFVAISAFVGGGLVFAGVTDWCGMALLLGKMPWNRRRSADSACSS